jgi:TPR repeat protein
MGESAGCYELGMMYYNGQDVPRDASRSNALNAKACGAGNADGCLSLGSSYKNGLGFRQDLSKAKEFYTKACSLGEQYGCEWAQEKYLRSRMFQRYWMRIWMRLRLGLDSRGRRRGGEGS